MPGVKSTPPAPINRVTRSKGPADRGAHAATLAGVIACSALLWAGRRCGGGAEPAPGPLLCGAAWPTGGTLGIGTITRPYGGLTASRPTVSPEAIWAMPSGASSKDSFRETSGESAPTSARLVRSVWARRTRSGFCFR